MVIKIFNNHTDIRYSQKNITLLATLSAVQVTDPVSVEEPIFLLDYDASYINANYVYVPEFKRNYVITNKEIVNGNQWRISCHGDVRVNFRNNLLNSEIIADRSSSNSDPYVPDPMVTIRDSITTYIRKVPNTCFAGPSGSNNFVLTLGGK